MLSRAMIGPYLCVFGGLALGLFVGVFLVDFEPKIVGWLFSAGAGLTGGAFIAALASGEQLVGGGSSRSRVAREYEAEWDEDEDEDFGRGPRA